MIMYDNEFEAKGNKIFNKEKIEPQQLHKIYLQYNYSPSAHLHCYDWRGIIEIFKF